VEVTVQDKNNQLLSDALVDLTLNGGVLQEVPTDDTGSVVFPGVDPGIYRVAVRRPGYAAFTTSNFRVKAGSMTSVSVALKAASGQLGRLTGTVRNPNGGPVVNATVQIVSGLSKGKSNTSAVGFYQLNNLIPADTYVIQISASGFATQTLANLTVIALQQTVQNVVLIPNAPTQGSLTGIVRDPNGNPIPSATVDITAGPALGQEAISGSDGRYTFTNLPPSSNYSIRAEAAGFLPAGATLIQVTAGKTTVINLVLGTRFASPGAIIGTVSDISGQPLSGAVVTVLSGPGAGIATTTTGVGTYRLDNLSAADDYIIGVTLSGYNGSSASAVVVQTGLTTTLNFQLTPIVLSAGTISGTVTDSSAHPIAGATVTVYVGPSSPVHTTTAADGTYSLPNLRAGTGYGLRVEKTNWTTAQKTGITVTTNGTTKVNITLTQLATLGTIQGRVLNLLTRAVSGARISILDGPTLADDVFSDSSGNFTFNGLAPGRYTLEVSSNDYQTADKSGIIVSAGGTANVTFTLLNP
jgi:protocatechuate 3,4-dioxygenase beta subunit